MTFLGLKMIIFGLFSRFLASFKIAFSSLQHPICDRTIGSGEITANETLYNTCSILKKMRLAYICIQLVVAIFGAMDTDKLSNYSSGLNFTFVYDLNNATIGTKALKRSFFENERKKGWMDRFSYEKRSPADEFMKLQNNRILVV